LDPLASFCASVGVAFWFLWCCLGFPSVQNYGVRICGHIFGPWGPLVPFVACDLFRSSVVPAERVWHSGTSTRCRLWAPFWFLLFFVGTHVVHIWPPKIKAFVGCVVCEGCQVCQYIAHAPKWSDLFVHFKVSPKCVIQYVCLVSNNIINTPP
jgi:hypothetical protein